MELLTKITAAFLLPLYQFSSTDHRFYWLYFVVPYAMAFVVVLWIRRSWSLSAVWTCLRDFFSRKIYTHRSAIADYKLLFLNNFAYVFIFPVAMISASYVTEVTAATLGTMAGNDGLHWQPTWASRLALTVAWLIAFDFGYFIAHYLNHKIPALWEFHKIHHSAEVMTPITVVRMHPVNDFFNFTIVFTLIGLAEGVFQFMYGDTAGAYTVNGLNIFWFLFLIGGYHLRHTHIWIMYPKPIRYLISSPALHLIHHSTDPKHFDKNMAQIFVFWDWLFGTLYMPEQREEFDFGIGGGEEREYQTLKNIYLLPFKKVARLYRPKEEAET